MGSWMKREDVQNEIRAVEKLCKPGTHKNIVTVLRHGPLDNSPFYYFDMELCDFNLETFSESLWKPATWEEMLTSTEKPFDIDSRMKTIWSMMSQIASGVLFIHLQQEVRRDLKPR